MRRIVVDTNVLVRALVRENSEQGRVAERLLSVATFVVLPTVLLESEWVMRGIMRISRQMINDLFSMALIVDQFDFQDAEALAVALKWHAAGMDFADALHVALAGSMNPFVTFDRGLIKFAHRYPDTVNVELAT